MKSKLNTFSWLLVFTLLVLFLIPGYSPANDKSQKIDELMTTYHKYRLFNGSVLVAEQGKIIYKNGFGFANMEWDIPNDPITKFRLGSITKQFTSMLIMQLVEMEKLRVDDKLADLLPYYREDTGKQVMVHHLLTHTSGIPSYTGLPNFFAEISRNPYPVEDFVKKFCSNDFEFEPGTKFKYNNSGYFLLGAIIEKITGKTYEQVLHENILDPLGMKNTGYDHHKTILKKRATGYEKTFDSFQNSAYLDMGLPYAAGSLYSTVEDLYTWDQALYGEKLLSNKYKKIMFQPFLKKYAYGWGVRKVAGNNHTDSLTFISHGGGINGFSTLITRIIEDKILVVLLNNTGGTNLNEMNDGILKILNNKPYNPPKLSIAETLYKTIIEKDVQASVKQYHQLKKEKPGHFNFSEAELNQLGYTLIQKKKMSDAIEIFKLNVEAFPEAFNVYDSLGEAYS